MTDLSSEEGIRQAIRDVAAWPATDSRPPARPHDEPPATLAPPSRSPVGSRLVLRAASVALLVLLAAGVIYLRSEASGPAGGPAGHWEPMADGPLSPRFATTSVWTGDELLIWGGRDDLGAALPDGARYDPRLDRWRSIAAYPFVWNTPSLQAGTAQYAIPPPSAWVGGEVFVVVEVAESDFGWDLVAYRPADDSWRQVEQARFDQLPTDELVRTGGEATVDTVLTLLAWDDRLVAYGWRSDLGAFGFSVFDPATATWSAFTSIPDSGDIYGFPLLADGPLIADDRLVVLHRGPAQTSGFIVELETGDVVSIDRPVDPRLSEPLGLWGRMSVDGLVVGLNITDDGQAARVAYHLDLVTGRWERRTPPRSGPTNEDNQAAVIATPSGYLLLGGLEKPGRSGGLRSTPSAHRAGLDVGRWDALPPPPISLDREGHIAVWTGREVIVWGGATAEEGGPVNVGTMALGDGARFIVD